MNDDEEPEAEAPPAERRYSVIDSEFLRVDDRIVKVEKESAKTAQDLYLVRQVLINQIVTVALVELALAAIVLVLVLNNRKEIESGI